MMHQHVLTEGQAISCIFYKNDTSIMLGTPYKFGNDKSNITFLHISDDITIEPNTFTPFKIITIQKDGLIHFVRANMEMFSDYENIMGIIDFDLPKIHSCRSLLVEQCKYSNIVL